MSGIYVRNTVFYALIIVVGFLVQVSVLPLFPLALATPNILLIISFSFGFIKGKRAGMFAGLFAGLLLDLFYGGTIGFYGLFYMYVGYINGICSKYYYVEYINLPLTLCIVNELAFGMYTYVFQFLLRNRLDFGYYFIKIILPEVVYTLVVTLLAYRFLLFLNRRLEEKEKERD